MKFNGTIFSKPQQDQLKENIGNELEKVSAKVDEVDARMLNYTGDWATDNEYHENDLVTWTDGQLYEVIKAHTSSASIKPGNTEYYKAMTEGGGVVSHTFNNRSDVYNYLKSIQLGKIKYIEIVSGIERFVLIPQSSTTEFSSTIMYTNDGGVRQFLLTISANSTNSFYVNTDKNGSRTITQISNITEYTVYVEE